MTRSKAFRKENEELIRVCKLKKKIKGYGLHGGTDADNQNGYGLLVSKNILKKADSEWIISWQKETEIGYRLEPRRLDGDG